MIEKQKKLNIEKIGETWGISYFKKVKNIFKETTSNLIGIKECKVPQISEHCP